MTCSLKALRAGIVAILLTSPAWARPLVIAHRGNSAQYPEHGLMAYRSSLNLGADFLEQDIVADKDGELWIRHERNLLDTTNAKMLFPKKIRNKELNIDDLHSHEVRRLKIRQRFSFRQQAYNFQEKILSLRDFVRWCLMQQQFQFGLYIESKDPDYYRAKGISLEKKILPILQPLLIQGEIPIIFQSESLRSLAEFRRLAPAQLRTLLIEKNLKIDWEKIPKWVDILGLQKEHLLPFNQILRISGSPTGVVRQAHARGFKVHIWTLRDEWWFRPFFWNGPAGEYQLLQTLGVDGVFSDNPETALRAFQ